MSQEFVPWLALAVAFAGLVWTVASSRTKRIKEIEESLAKKASMDDVRELWGAVKGKAGVEDMHAVAEVCGKKASADLMQVLYGKVDHVEDRATRIETELKHLPDRSTTHRMEMSVSSLSGDVRVLTEQLKPIAAIAERLQAVILENAKL